MTRTPTPSRPQALPEPLMTLRDVGAYLRIGPRTVLDAISAGHLPAFKVGRLWRLRREDRGCRGVRAQRGVRPMTAPTGAPVVTSTRTGRVLLTSPCPYCARSHPYSIDQADRRIAARCGGGILVFRALSSSAGGGA